MGKRLVQTKRGGLAVVDAEPSRDDFGDANSILWGQLSAQRHTSEVWLALYGMHKALVPESERYVPKRDRDDYAEFVRNRPPPASQFEAIARIVYGTDPEEIALSMDETWEDADNAKAHEYIVVLRDLGPAGVKGEVTRTPITAAEEQCRIGIARPAESWEVLAATVFGSGLDNAWGRGLEVASVLHTPDRCEVAQIREAATWPN